MDITLPWCLAPKDVKCNVGFNSYKTGEITHVGCGHKVIPAGTICYKFPYGDNIYWCIDCCKHTQTTVPEDIERMATNAKKDGMIVNLTSFSIRKGLDTPTNKPYYTRVFDISKRIRNPWQIKELRSLNGLNPKVQEYIRKCPKTDGVLKEIQSYAKAGYENLFVGCYGGKHRSVAIVDMAAKQLEADGFTVNVNHRDLKC